MVADYFSAELTKLARRPASWILGAVTVLSLLLFGYLFTYVFAANAQGGNASQGADPDAILQPLLPENVLPAVLGNLSGLTAAVALVFGALVTGSEYGWGTLKLMLSQRPGRLNMLSGKILAVAVLLAGLTVIVILLGILSSAIVASLQDKPSDWPSVWQMVKGLGAGWLILASWASFGLFLGILFRGAALAIGVGLIYLLVIEGLILGLPIQGDTFTTIQKIFLGKNAMDLAGSFGQLQQGAAPGDTVDPSQAVFVLVAYVAALLLVSILLFRRRDV